MKQFDSYVFSLQTLFNYRFARLIRSTDSTVLSLSQSSSYNSCSLKNTGKMLLFSSNYTLPRTTKGQQTRQSSTRLYILFRGEMKKKPHSVIRLNTAFLRFHQESFPVFSHHLLKPTCGEFRPRVFAHVFPQVCIYSHRLHFLQIIGIAFDLAGI